VQLKIFAYVLYICVFTNAVSYMHVCVCVHLHACIFHNLDDAQGIHLHVSMCVSLSLAGYTYMHGHTHTGIRVYIWLHVYIHYFFISIFQYPFTCMYVCTNIHIHQFHDYACLNIFHEL